MRRYYAADNGYGTNTNIGFSNTWYVLVFGSRAARDHYVDTVESRAARAITRRQVPHYAANWHMTQNRLIRPAPFTREYWGIEPMEYGPCPPGCIGRVVVAHPDDRYARFSK